MSARTRRRRSAGPRFERTCPVEGCQRTYGRKYCMCRWCWEKVPGVLKFDYHRARERRLEVQADPEASEAEKLDAIEAHRKAIEAAVRWVEDPV